jgi:predicted secreted acid phosphatase
MFFEDMVKTILCISSRETSKERRDTIANLASRNRNEKIQITVLFRQDILSRLGQKGGKKSSF